MRSFGGLLGGVMGSPGARRDLSAAEGAPPRRWIDVSRGASQFVNGRRIDCPTESIPPGACSAGGRRRPTCSWPQNNGRLGKLSRLPRDAPSRALSILPGPFLGVENRWRQMSFPLADTGGGTGRNARKQRCGTSEKGSRKDCARFRPLLLRRQPLFERFQRIAACVCFPYRVTLAGTFLRSSGKRRQKSRHVTS